MVPRIYSQNRTLRISIFLLFLFSCSFSFGQNPPSFITCPANATVTLPPGGGTLTFTSVNIPFELGVEAIDPDGNETITYSATPSSVSCGDIGVVMVTVIASDSDGPASCANIMVMVEDGGPLAVCNSFTATLDGTGMATVNFADVGGGSSNCAGAFTAETIDGAASQTYDCTDIGTFPVTVLVTDAFGSSNCTAMVTIEDAFAPTVTAGAQGNIAANNDAGLCSAVVNYAVPTFDDNCGGAAQAGSRTAGPASGSAFPVGTTTVTHSFTDDGGTTVTHSFNVTVSDTQAPTVSVGAQGNINTTTNSTTQCGAVVNYTAPSFDDNCGGLGQAGTRIAGPASGATFGLGVTTVTHEFTDVAGTKVSHSFTVTVSDNDDPTVTTPTANITMDNDPGMCSAVVTYTAPVFEDNCDGAGLSGTRTVGPASGSTFPLGITTITYEYTDAAGNGPIASSFTVTVNDTEAPDAAAGNPGPITVNNDSGVCQATVSWPSISLTADNCPGTVTVVFSTIAPKNGTVNITTAFQAGSLVDVGDFPVGTTTVNYTISDMATPPNTDMGTFTVTVNDNEAPTIICPPTQTQHFASCNAAAEIVPDFRNFAGVSDNCSSGYTVTQIPVPGSLLSAVSTPANGETYSVTLTVTDNFANNLSASCSFDVDLLEDNALTLSNPVAVLPPESSTCGAILIEAPTAFDACGNFYCGVPFPAATIVSGNCNPNGNPMTNTITENPSIAIGNPNATSTTTISVAGQNPVLTDLDVGLDITHSWVGDMIVSITSPEGTTITLFERPGIPTNFGLGCDGNDLDVVFDEDATDTYATFFNTCNNAPAIEGTFQSFGNLNTFNGEDPNGDWTLTVFDNDTGFDPGVLNQVDLVVTASGPTSVPVYEFPAGPAHNITWTFSDGNGNTTSQLQTITAANDTAPPTLTCTNITVELDENGEATVGAGNLLGESFTLGTGSGPSNVSEFCITVPNNIDIAFAWDYTQEPDFDELSFSIDGTSTVLTDENGPSAQSGSENVSVSAGETFCITLDNDFSVFSIANITFSDGLTGDLAFSNWVANGPQAIYNAPDITDNCGVDFSSILANGGSTVNFDCNNIGSNSITVTANDINSNPGSCIATVTVVDNTIPVFDVNTVPANMVVDCDNIPAVAVGIVATDNCGTVGMNFNEISNQNGNSSLCADYNYTITRTWTATDANGNSASHVQTINVVDNEAPVFTLPTTIDVSADQGACEATVSLSVSASDLSDNCAPFANITITNDAPIGADNVQIGDGSTDASGVYPVGSTPVTFTAVDPCGKSTDHIVMVNVTDDTPPIVSCKNNVAATIPAGATEITIPYDLIDNGSFDNCAGLIYSVFPSTFDCSQADGVTEWDITLFVTEDVPGGQTSSCETTIIIQDNTNPVALCQDITIFLDENGNASITAADIDNGSFDACSGIQSISLLSQSTFTVDDVGDNQASIVVTDNNNNSLICGSTVTVSPPETCFSVDDGIMGAGFLAGTGISEVPVNTTNFVNSLGFQFTLEIDETVAEFVGINNVHPDLNTNGFLTFTPNATGDTLTLSWFNTSGIPLTLNTAQLFTVTVDVVGVVGAMTPINFIDTPAPAQFTSRYGTTIFTSPEFLPCTEDGKLTVDVTATLTVSGNIRTWGITTMDSTFTMTTPPDTMVTTTVVVPVQNVANVVVSKTETHPGLNGGVPLFAANAGSTDVDGNYTVVVSNQPGGVTLDLNARKDTPNWLNNGDVNALDLARIQQHIVTNEDFTSIFEYVASDVDEDGLITTLDLILIQDVLLNASNSTVITDYDPWRFVPAADSLHLDTLPGQPFAPLINEEISFNNYTTALTDVDWIAVKIGQVRDPLNTQLLTSNVAETRTGNDFEMLLENQKVVTGERISIPVYAKDYADFIAWQFTLEFDENTLSFDGIEPGVITGFGENKLGLNAVEEGIIGAIWYGTPIEVKEDDVLFTLNFIANGNADALSGLFDISSKTVNQLTGLEDGRLGDVKLSFFEPTTVENHTAEFELHQNRPNPFNGKTMISFVLPEAGFGKITVYDISGKELKTIEGDFVKGYNEISIQSNDLSVSGVLYYKLESTENTATKKMIILD